jgi:hypothetical protein
MALIGGGGAGNVSGGAPAGTGTSFNYIGNHGYGYSGQLLVSNSEITALEFATPNNNYIESNIQLLWTTTSNDFTGDDALVLVYIDDQVVSGILASSAHKNASELLKLIFPAGVNVKITIRNAAAGTAHYGYISVTGEVHA